MTFLKIFKPVIPKSMHHSGKQILIKLGVYGRTFPYRRYADRNRCIFIHIPKTAGTSVLASLAGQNFCRDHVRFSEFKRVDPLRFESYFKFCFVRNPYDRLVSCYEYLKAGGNKRDDLYFKELLANYYPSFDSFVLHYLDQHKIHEHILFQPQYIFIFNCRGECEVDFVGRYESISSDFSIVCEKLRVTLELPSENASLREPYKSYYSNESVRKKVYNLYLKDFVTFNYPEDISLT